MTLIRFFDFPSELSVGMLRIENDDDELIFQTR